MAALETLEAAVFHRLLHAAWWRQLVPAMQLPTCDGVAPRDAAAHWAAAAAAVRNAFCPARAAGATCGCLPHLGHQVLQECLQRLDVALFNALLRGPRPPGDPSGSDDPVADPLSDEAAMRLLPGALAPCSFGSGMRLKMFVGDLTDALETAHHAWLASGGRQLNGDTPRPFPFVRSAADVLMMPKDGLQDPSVRADVRPRAPALSPYAARHTAAPSLRLPPIRGHSHVDGTEGVWWRSGVPAVAAAASAQAAGALRAG